MKKIAFVTQRYGLEVNGGAEVHCRLLAERLSDKYDVDVITTKAIDYVTWKDEYTEDEEYINGVHVKRFSVDHVRDNNKFNKYSERILQLGASIEEEEKWMDLQGPHSSDLIRYLEDEQDNYDVFIFLCYLYYTTYYGLKAVGAKSILIPTAHDELPIYLGIFKNMFRWPKALFYNAEAEKRFVEGRFGIEDKLNNSGHGGIGIEVPEDISAERFRDKYGLSDFVLYIGRIEEHKGCREMFRYFEEYKKRNPGNLKLVLMGKSVIDVPERDDIVSLGFVSEEDKYDGLAASSFLLLPSKYESLSIVVLEAMALEKTVLIDAECEVVRDHCTVSNGGLYYHGFYEFEGCVNYILENSEICKKMGKNGKAYVDRCYTWDSIIGRLEDMIERVAISQ